MADVKTFMKLIKAMESSGGKDTNHRTIASGIHEGDSAVGSYGLMPNTVKEIAKRRGTSPSDDVITNLPNDQVNTLLKENPELAKQYAEILARKLLDKTNNDPALAMTGWHYGHNMSLPQLKQKAEDNPDYIQKVDQRIYENNLQSKMPSLVDMLKPAYKDEPMSKKK